MLRVESGEWRVEKDKDGIVNLFVSLRAQRGAPSGYALWDASFILIL